MRRMVNDMDRPEAYHANNTLDLDDRFPQRMLLDSMRGMEHALQCTRHLIGWPKHAPQYTRHLMSFRNKTGGYAFLWIIHGNFVMSSFETSFLTPQLTWLLHYQIITGTLQISRAQILEDYNGRITTKQISIFH